MDDLVAFVHACIDEDAAEIAKQPDGEGEFEGIGLWASGDVLSNTSYLIVNKARALREVEAKRRMLNDLYPEVKGADEAIQGEWNSSPWNSDTLLEMLALPYADRPGYKEKWRPTRQETDGG